MNLFSGLASLIAAILTLTPGTSPWIQVRDMTEGEVPGVGVAVLFPNGYGADIVRHQHSIGGPGSWELAVTDCRGHLIYDTPITDNVIGYLDEKEVIDICRDINDLPSQEIRPRL